MDCEKRILGILNTKDRAASLGLFKTRNRIAVHRVAPNLERDAEHVHAAYPSARRVEA